MTPEPLPGSPEEEIFRDALHRTAGTLAPPLDLVPEAVREGRLRRARSRGLAVVGAFVAVTAVTLGLALLGPLLRSAPDTEPAGPAPGPSLTRPVPDPSPTRPTPGPSPDPTEPVTGMPTPTPSSPSATPPWTTSPAAPTGGPSGAVPATPDPTRSGAALFAPSPAPGTTK
ncbi:hypothetical protein ACTFBT_23520 [Streptomyces microflavus]|uniref:Uncharacterized protein n=1 Tax=Streptomyces microflavus TaxID=1919 RepID=A0A7J0CWC8_STRMI|nr:MULTISPECIES: hypothetical protein [Streptomyces]MDX2976018.1 hypothetical protein [Streptomyces sp. NRRL_B-2249]GFN06214.1 hypothetical protein Smic_47700 [Streptomyces microflavus]GGX75667.1 hypothetical protein GCM10010298_45980 [Streptomyces microflavus]